MPRAAQSSSETEFASRPQAESSEPRSARKLGVAESDVVVIWIGSLEEHKDPLTAVHAAQRGLGKAARRRRRQLAASGGASRRREHQVLGQRSDVPRLLAAADVYLLTSRREGLALSLLEAMGHGLAVVVTDLPENLEAIGDTGIPVRPDESSVAAALRRLAADADERRDLGTRAAQRVSRLFDATEMTRRTRALYDATAFGARREAEAREERWYARARNGDRREPGALDRRGRPDSQRLEPDQGLPRAPAAPDDAALGHRRRRRFHRRHC